MLISSLLQLFSQEALLSVSTQHLIVQFLLLSLPLELPLFPELLLLAEQLLELRLLMAELLPGLQLLPVVAAGTAVTTG
jgi:hypothetical protein